MKNKTLILFIAAVLFIVFNLPVFALELKRHEVLPRHMEKLENRLIKQTEQAEEILFKKGALYDDPEVEAYINKVGMSIIPADFSNDKVEIKFKIIRDATVNAFALPNGTIYVHTGILARLGNEAQLAFLLGHEISHIVNMDSVYFINSVHSKTVTAKLFDMVLAPASIFFGLLGDLVRSGFGLLYVSTVTGYSREQEARADIDAIKVALEKGYDPAEAPKLIEMLMSEHDKYQRGEEIYFLMSHPSNKIRLKRMNKRINEYYKDRKGKTDTEEFFRQMVKLKNYNALLNIKMDRLMHGMDNVKSVLNVRPDDAEAHFYAAEIYRLMYNDPEKLKYELSQKEWLKKQKAIKKQGVREAWRNKALEEYKLALLCNPDYHDAIRGLGLFYLDTGDEESALANLTRYLELNPEAKDKRYVKNILKRINRKNDL